MGVCGGQFQGYCFGGPWGALGALENTIWFMPKIYNTQGSLVDRVRGMDPPFCKVGVRIALEYLHTQTQAMLTFWLFPTSCKLMLLSHLDTFCPMRGQSHGRTNESQRILMGVELSRQRSIVNYCHHWATPGSEKISLLETRSSGPPNVVL